MKDPQASSATSLAPEPNRPASSSGHDPSQPADSPSVLEMLGELDFQVGGYADAAQQYCAALESNPNEVSLLMHLGKCQNERDPALARWCFERVLALEPSNLIAAEALQILAAHHDAATPVSDPAPSFLS